MVTKLSSVSICSRTKCYGNELRLPTSTLLQLVLAASILLLLTPASLCAPLPMPMSHVSPPGLSDLADAIGGNDGGDTASLSANSDSAADSTSLNSEPISLDGSNGKVEVDSSGNGEITTETTSDGNLPGETAEETGNTTSESTSSDSTPSDDTAHSPESSGDTKPESVNDSGNGGIVENVKRLGVVVIAGAAAGGVLILVIIVVICVWCTRIRRARRLSNEAIKARDADAYVPADRSLERRDSIPWGHPSLGPR